MVLSSIRPIAGTAFYGRYLRYPDFWPTSLGLHFQADLITLSPADSSLTFSQYSASSNTG